ncbi:MAG: hypothetical protein J5508_03530 [Bacteroidales bacterium]|jgi:hypothetical protein|nr:hypothetical protein [Bacteroidales bacterium]MBR5671397.1 hypothetical protein [Bacteroidales bacterium]
MGVFFFVFLAFMVVSIVISEQDRKRRAAARRTHIPPVQDFKDVDFKVPEQAKAPQDNTYYGEDVPRTTTATEVRQESKPAGKELDLDPEKMIIYSEILKPKF